MPTVAVARSCLAPAISYSPRRQTRATRACPTPWTGSCSSGLWSRCSTGCDGAFGSLPRAQYRARIARDRPDQTREPLLAMAHHPRTEVRVHMLLWHLADRDASAASAVRSNATTPTDTNPTLAQIPRTCVNVRLSAVSCRTRNLALVV